MEIVFGLCHVEYLFFLVTFQSVCIRSGRLKTSMPEEASEMPAIAYT